MEMEADADAGPDYVDHLGAARAKAAGALAPLLEGLPGVTRELAAEFGSGRLDQRLLAMGASLLARGTRSDFLRRSRLRELRDGLVAKVRQRARLPEERQGLDALDQLYRTEWTERFNRNETRAEAGENPPAPGGDALPDPARRLRAALAEDLGSLRRAAARAARLGGEDRLQPSCWTDQPRATRRRVAQAMAAAQAMGREGPEPPRALLAPLLGRGACAWDLNLLVVALRPSAGVEDAVATALGDWLVQDDRERRGGEWARAFAGRMGGGDFAEEFPEAYRLWLCQAAKGDREALSPGWRAFMRDHVGPPLDGPVIPPNLRNLTPQTRLALRRRLETLAGGPRRDGNLHRRFGALCWLDGLYDEAFLHFQDALRQDPGDEEAALSLGLALRARGQEAKAQSIFAMGAARAGGTLWGLYCHDLLRGDNPAAPRAAGGS